ncbi:hypothetical protein B9127_23730 [Shigella sonnei]|nr:hypothetical protein B9127_23730 [Shigella sonnei]OKS97609.1 hypothetical protein ACN54_19855 [Escherichia coli]TEZ13441.1 hypothetical protein BON66_21630 [Escherichia coli]
MLRLAGELPIVRVLNDFQLLSILRIFCMRGFLPPPTDPPWLYASVSRTAMCQKQNLLTLCYVNLLGAGHKVQPGRK